MNDPKEAAFRAAPDRRLRAEDITGKDDEMSPIEEGISGATQSRIDAFQGIQAARTAHRQREAKQKWGDR